MLLPTTSTDASTQPHNLSIDTPSHLSPSGDTARVSGCDDRQLIVLSMSINPRIPSGDVKKVSGCATIGDIAISRYEKFPPPEMQSDSVESDKISETSHLPYPRPWTTIALTGTRLNLGQRGSAQRGASSVSIDMRKFDRSAEILGD